MPQLLAIIGATGMLGKPVTDQLIRAGFSVRIVARNVAQAQMLFPDAEVVAGDLRKPETLTNALRGVDTVYLSFSVKQTEKRTDFHTEAGGLQNLLIAAKQVGVKRVAYLSSLVMRYQGMNGFDWWVFRVKYEAVRLIRESGLDYSIFYPSCFMESMNQTQRVGRLVLLLDRSPVKPYYVSAQDYGRQVARALQLAKPEQKQEYVIQGPEAITQHEAAERFLAAYKPEKLRLVTTPLWLMKLGCPFSAQANYGWHIGTALNNYPEVFEAEITWQELGKPTITIEQFAQSLTTYKPR